MRLTMLAATVGAIAFSALPATAAPIIVANASFEAPVLTGGTYQPGDSTIPGWMRFGNTSAGVQNFGDDGYFKPADGAQVVYINGGTLVQDIGALLANTTYTLTVAAGNQPNYGRGATGSFGFYSATGQELSSAIAVPLPVGSMSDFSTSFTTGDTVSGDLFIALSLRSDVQVLFDNIRVDAVGPAGGAVPEPATWATMTLGLGLVGAALRRRTARVATA